MISKMAVTNFVVNMLLLCVVLTISAVHCQSGPWPVPYQPVPSRPKSSSYCQAGVQPFCPTGRASNSMPTFPPSDTLYVYAMKAPVWEFKFGDLLEEFHIMHDAIGFHHVQSGANFTMEWYELFQLFNCTFPHLLKNNTLLWCNQGAACIYNGIDEKHWKQNGTLVKVATMTGETFNQFANWTEADNNTNVFYETWTVRQKPDGPLWFDSWECASWVLRAYQAMFKYGAKFNQSVHLNYTRMNIYSNQPMLLGNASTIFDGNNETLAKDVLQFYSYFQSHQSMPQLILSLLKAFSEIVEEGRFYFFYNQKYWQLPVVEPYVRLTYEGVKLPGP